jgi:hypothetical protein
VEAQANESSARVRAELAAIFRLADGEGIDHLASVEVLPRTALTQNGPGERER